MQKAKSPCSSWLRDMKKSVQFNAIFPILIRKLWFMHGHTQEVLSSELALTLSTVLSSYETFLWIYPVLTGAVVLLMAVSLKSRILPTARDKSAWSSLGDFFSPDATYMMFPCHHVIWVFGRSTTHLFCCVGLFSTYAASMFASLWMMVMPSSLCFMLIHKRHNYPSKKKKVVLTNTLNTYPHIS